VGGVRPFAQTLRDIIVAQGMGQYDIMHDIIGFCMISYMILYMIIV
jgi:hypothetical protein